MVLDVINDCSISRDNVVLVVKMIAPLVVIIYYPVCYWCLLY